MDKEGRRNKDARLEYGFLVYGEYEVCPLMSLWRCCCTVDVMEMVTMLGHEGRGWSTLEVN